MGLLHPHGRELVQQSLVKMQRCSGRCHRTGVLGKDRLVALGVFGRVGVGDVGRQRHVAVALHQGVRVVATVVRQHEAEQRAVGIRPAPEQGGAQAICAIEPDRGTHLGFFADPHMRCHLVAAQHPFDQQFHLAAGRLFAKQPRLYHPGVIEHQQVARQQQPWQFTKNTVHRAGLRAV